MLYAVSTVCILRMGFKAMTAGFLQFPAPDRISAQAKVSPQHFMVNAVQPYNKIVFFGFPQKVIGNVFFGTVEGNGLFCNGNGRIGKPVFIGLFLL